MSLPCTRLFVGFDYTVEKTDEKNLKIPGVRVMLKENIKDKGNERRIHFMHDSCPSIFDLRV